MKKVYWRIYNDPEHTRHCLAEFLDRYISQLPCEALIPLGSGDLLNPKDVFTRVMAKGIP